MLLYITNVKINTHAKYCNIALSTHIFHIPLKKSYFQNAFACHHKDTCIYKKGCWIVSSWDYCLTVLGAAHIQDVK